jgi:hypothetical protein
MDGIESAALSNIAAWWGHVAVARGGVVEEHEDLVVIDAHGPNPVMNRAVLRRPGAAAEDVARRTSQVYARATGGPFSVWDPYGELDLSPYGFAAPIQLPHMALLEPGSGPVEGVTEAGTVDLPAAESIVRESFDFVPWDDSPFLPTEGRARVFLAGLDGEVAATALAFGHAGVTGVYLVGTRKSARGRGLGEAVSWAATRAFPGQPAVLQASEMGLGVYERMGYAAFNTLRVWFSPRG